MVQHFQDVSASQHATDLGQQIKLGLTNDDISDGDNIVLLFRKPVLLERTQVQLSGQVGCTTVQKKDGQVCGKPVLPECTDVQQADLGDNAAVQPFTDQSRVLGEAHLQQQQQLQPGVEAMCSAKGQLFRDARS